MSELILQCGCGNRLKLRAEHCGKKGRCNRCSKPITVPAAPFFEKHAGEMLTLDQLQTLLAAGAPPEPPPSTGLWRPGQIVDSRYEVKRLLGEGTFGSVWHVWHREWRAELAVKQLKKHTPASLQRFQREAQAWIDLGLHPHVVTAWYVRQLGGVPHLFLEYCEGGSLAEWIEQGRTRDLGTALDIAIQLCWGLAHCHQKGIVHRDFKPQNVVMSQSGTARITDFGTVKFAALEAIEEGGEGEVFGHRGTIGGQLQGTPPYMPPEQWVRGGDVSWRVDLYALGVTLFEMLTGEYPVRPAEANIAGWARAHAQQAPVLLRAVRPDLPEALDQVLGVCLQKQPERRGITPRQLAQWLAIVQEQVTGRPAGRAEPQPASLLADSLNNQGVSLQDLGRDEGAERLWEQALRIDPRHPEATYNLGLARWRKAGQNDDDLVRQLSEVRASHPTEPASHYLLALAHLERGDFPSIREVLRGSTDTEHQETARLRERAERDQERGRRCLRSCQGCEEYLTAVALFADGEHALLGAGDGSVQLWSLGEGRSVRKWGGHEGGVTALCLSGDGRHALSAGQDQAFRVWDLGTGKQVHTCTGAGSPIALAWGPSGWYALIREEGKAYSLEAKRHWQLLEVTAGRVLTTLDAGPVSMLDVALGAGGRLALVGQGTWAVRVWDFARGEPPRDLKGHSALPSPICISADGKRAASGSLDGRIKLWDVASGRALWTLSRRAGYGALLALSPDGSRLLYACRGEPWELWDLHWEERAPAVVCRVSSSEQVLSQEQQVRGELEEARARLAGDEAAAAASNVQRVLERPGYGRHGEALALQADLCRRLPRKRLRDGWEERLLEGHTNQVSAVAMARDGSRGLSAGWDRTLRVWSLPTGRCERVLEGHGDLVTAAHLGADGRLALSGGADRLVVLWDLDTGTRLCSFEGHQGEVCSVCLRQDGRLALSSDWQGEVRLWEAQTGRCLRTWMAHQYCANSVCFSPDGLLALSGGDDRKLQLWDLASGRCLRTFPEHGHAVSTAAFSADGRKVLSGTGHSAAREAGVLRLWDVRTGECQQTFEGHTDQVLVAALSPDGRFLVSGGGVPLAWSPGILKVWETSTGRCLRTFEAHRNSVTGLSWSEDGCLLLTGSSDRTLKLWRLSWDLEEQERADWAEGARPYLEAFLSWQTPPAGTLPAGREATEEELALALTRRGQPAWTDADLGRLLKALGCAGYGWLRPEGVRQKLDEMTAGWPGPAPLPG